jgi:hypothetical protein
MKSSNEFRILINFIQISVSLKFYDKILVAHLTDEKFQFNKKNFNC